MQGHIHSFGTRFSSLISYGRQSILEVAKFRLINLRTSNTTNEHVLVVATAILYTSSGSDSRRLHVLEQHTPANVPCVSSSCEGRDAASVKRGILMTRVH